MAVFVVDVESVVSVLDVCGSGTGGGIFVGCVPGGSMVSIFGFRLSVCFKAERSSFEALRSLADRSPALSPTAPD